MSTKKASIKETTTTTPTVGGENGDETSNGGEKQKRPPTFDEMWFDDPVEGREAQRLALKLRNNVVLRAEPMRIYLERTGIIPMLLQGLQHLEKARPKDPAEWLAAFLLKNNPRRDMIITPPIKNNPNSKSNATTEPIVELKVDPKKK